MKTLTKVILFGWNGCLNVGDDAMTCAILLQLSKIYKIKKVIIWGDHDNLALIENFTIDSIQGIKNKGVIDHIKGVRTIVAERVWAPRHLKDCDLMIFGGGSIFRTHKVMKSFINFIETAKKFNPQVNAWATSVSIGPFEGDDAKETGKRVLALFDAISVRDQRSAELIRKLNVKTAYRFHPDIALSYPRLKEEVFNVHKGSIRKVGISLRADYVHEDIISKLRLLGEVLHKKVDKVELSVFELCADKASNDARERYKLLDVLPESISKTIRIVSHNKQPWSFYTEIASMDIMFCMRLHAGIISYAVKTPLMLLPYSEKCIDFGKEVLNLTDESFLFTKDSEQVTKNKINLFIENYNSFDYSQYVRIVDESLDQIDYLSKQVSNITEIS